MSGGMMRGKFIQPEDVLDRIYKAWIEHKIDDLALQDRWILERMEYIDAILTEGGKRAVYKYLIEDVYEAFKAHDITRRTIETDIARAKKFFLATRPREDKDYAKAKYIQWGELQLADYKARKQDKAWNALYKELGEIQGFKKDDIDAPDYSLLQPVPVMVVINPVDLGVPEILNLDEELRLLNLPKSKIRDNDQFEEGEIVDGNE
ncbi:hypothetical protein [Mucilaginibacter sp.]